MTAASVPGGSPVGSALASSPDLRPRKAWKQRVSSQRGCRGLEKKEKNKRTQTPLPPPPSRTRHPSPPPLVTVPGHPSGRGSGSRTLGPGPVFFPSIADFLKAPPGHQFNYQEKILDRKPDLVIMEFHNDFGRTHALCRR